MNVFSFFGLGCSLFFEEIVPLKSEEVSFEPMTVSEDHMKNIGKITSMLNELQRKKGYTKEQIKRRRRFSWV